MRLVECVPNFSEGRRLEVIQAIAAAAVSVPAVRLLDQHADSAHNRSVLTLAGPAPAVAEAAFRAVRRATELIDLAQHQGEHPRIGAADVVPFVPLGDTTMAECVDLAREVGARIGAELGIPVYLYAEAATREENRWLPHVRRGEYEGLRAEIGRLPERDPDFGPKAVGPAGATAVGARPFLIAFNVNLATDDVTLARSIARAVRQSSGGLPAVQARGMATESPGLVQVSMNLLDYRVTPLEKLFERVRQLAREASVEVANSELVGLVPAEALTQVAAAALLTSHIGPRSVIEYLLATGDEAPSRPA
jgi:glutamate formiminotransferase